MVPLIVQHDDCDKDTAGKDLMSDNAIGWDWVPGYSVCMMKKWLDVFYK